MNAHQFPPQRRPYPSCPFVDLPALPSDHRLSETNPHFWLNPSPPTPAAPKPPLSKAKDFRVCYIAFAPPKLPRRPPATTTQRENRNDFNTLQKPQERQDPLPRQRPRAARRLLYRPHPRRQSMAVALARRQGLVSAARAHKRIPDRLRRAIEKLSTGIDQVLEGKLAPAAATAAAPAASCPPPPVCCHAPKTFSRNLS